MLFEAVINKVLKSLPLKHTLDVHPSGTGIWPIFSPFLSKIVTPFPVRSEEHTSELQSRGHLVCRLLLEKKKHTAIHLVREIEQPALIGAHVQQLRADVEIVN